MSLVLDNKEIMVNRFFYCEYVLRMREKEEPESKYLCEMVSVAIVTVSKQLIDGRVS